MDAFAALKVLPQTENRLTSTHIRLSQVCNMLHIDAGVSASLAVFSPGRFASLAAPRSLASLEASETSQKLPSCFDSSLWLTFALVSLRGLRQR